MSKYNFYAYKIGEEEGIVTTWAECQQKINGQSSANYKGFKTRKEAEQFLSSAYVEAKAVDYSKFETIVHTDGGTRKVDSLAEVDANTVCGYAYLVENKNNDIRILKGKAEKGKTNNMMEITAVRDALKELLKQNLNTSKILFVCDSKYALSASDKSWFREKRWNENAEMWEEIGKLLQSNDWNITWAWTQGHNGEEGNEIVDRELNREMNKLEAQERPVR